MRVILLAMSVTHAESFESPLKTVRSGRVTSRDFENLVGDTARQRKRLSFDDLVGLTQRQRPGWFRYDRTHKQTVWHIMERVAEANKDLTLVGKNRGSYEERRLQWIGDRDSRMFGTDLRKLQTCRHLRILLTSLPHETARTGVCRDCKTHFSPGTLEALLSKGSEIQPDPLARDPCQSSSYPERKHEPRRELDGYVYCDLCGKRLAESLARYGS